MRTARSIVAGLFAMLVGSTVLAAACDGFTDVDSANSTYCSAVTYLKDKGITLGCTGTTYCPNDFVTRLQMALFLQRMGKGGSNNTLGTSDSVIGGGSSNLTGSNPFNVVGGGSDNSAQGGWDTVGGGSSNIASGGESVVVGGQDNSASGSFGVVLGGYNNAATGQFAIAAGQQATADQSHCAVFDLWTATSITRMNCGGSTDVFRIGASHGFSIDYGTEQPNGYGDKYVGIGDLSSGKTIATWTGAFLSDAGVWTNVSDRAAKDHFTPISSEDVLNRVVSLPIERWQYKVEPDATHIGPVAQDFYAAFSVGSDDRHITTIDEGGVALAAIQGLNAKLEASQALIAEQAHELAEIKAQLAAMAPTH